MLTYGIKEGQCCFYDKKRFFIGVLDKLVGVIKKPIFKFLIYLTPIPPKMVLTKSKFRVMKF